MNFVREQSIPSFFTFVSTDETACSSYFHCLIYYEKIEKEALIHDFDFSKAKKKHENDLKDKHRKESILSKRLTR